MSTALQNDTLPNLTRLFGFRAHGLTGRLVAALRQAVPVEEIWLFGSCARGEGRPDSDLDLLVVLADDHGLGRPNLACFQAVNHLPDVPPVDVVSVSKNRWLHERSHPFGLFGDASQQGVCLYAK